MKYLVALVVLICTALYGLAQVPMTGAGKGAPGGGAAATTFNPSDQSGITFSNGNLTIVASGGSDGSTRTNSSHSTGKYYFCGTIQVAIAGGNTAFGIANGSTNLATAPNSTNLVAAVYPGSGAVWVNGSNVVGLSGGSINDVYDIAFDAGGQLFWARRNNGNWNNDVSANPAIGTGGFSTSGFAGAYYGWGSSAGGTSQTWTATFGGTCANTAPVGFGNF